MNKAESKYFNTAVKMDEALLTLLEKKDFEYITVKEICEQAGVNRSTFYLHYETTRDLLMETLEYIDAQFLGYFQIDASKAIDKIKSGSLDDLVLITPEYLTPYLAFIRDHKKVFASALKKPDTFQSNISFQKMFEHIFNPIMERLHIPQSERNYILSFYIRGIMGIVGEWLKQDCSDPINVIAGIIMKCILPVTDTHADKTHR